MATNSMKPHISIIISTISRPQSLRLTMESIGRATVPGDFSAELLVVDNGPTNSTESAVTSTHLGNMPVRYLQEPRKGKVNACNTGIAEARGEIFLFTDDDVRVPINWVEDMCRPIYEGIADAVQGGVRIPPHLDRPWLTGALRVWLVEVTDPVNPPEGVLVGSSMALSRKAIEMVGGFNNRLGPGASGCFEDTMLGWKLRQAGGNILYEPKIAVDHHFDADRLEVRSFIKAAQVMAISKSVVDEILHPNYSRPSIFDFLLEIPGFTARCLTQLIAYLENRRPDPGFIIRYYRLCLWIARRKKLQKPSELPWPFR